jgi:hypothetical protein
MVINLWICKKWGISLSAEQLSTFWKRLYAMGLVNFNFSFFGRTKIGGIRTQGIKNAWP